MAEDTWNTRDPQRVSLAYTPNTVWRNRCEFLTGRDGKWHGCSFDWILKPANWQKITEGNYENKNYPIRQVESGDREPSYDLDEYMNNALHTSISYQKRGEENE